MTFDESVHARMANINRLIAMIASLDRKFFSSDSDGHGKGDTEVIACFRIQGKRLSFVDAYTRKEIWMRRDQMNPPEFSNGGTLWALTKDFADFILTGNYTNHKHGYGGLYCPHWGYSEESMDKIRQLARAIGYLAPTVAEDAELSRKAIDGEVVALAKSGDQP